MLEDCCESPRSWPLYWIFQDRLIENAFNRLRVIATDNNGLSYNTYLHSSFNNMKCLLFIGSLIFVALDSIRIRAASRLPLADAKCIGELPLVLFSLFYTGCLFSNNFI